MKNRSKFGRLDDDDEDEDEASWQDSYSDLMTDLLAIFVILFSFAMMSQAYEASKAKSASGQNVIAVSAESTNLPSQSSILPGQDSILPDHESLKYDEESFNNLYKIEMSLSQNSFCNFIHNPVSKITEAILRQTFI